ncbi:tetratricopeptide repeat protein, partial [bacterium]
MAALAANEARLDIAATWQREYESHLEGRLESTLRYLGAIPAAELRSHARSFFALLQETQRYPRMLGTTLRLIAALHPLPMHWGMTYAWEPVLRFALEHTPRDETPQRAEYRCALGDVLLFTGRFDEAVEQSRTVLSIASVPEALVARAGRIAFLSLRFSGKRAEAEGVLEQGRARFMADRPSAEVPADLAMAWLVCNQSRLEWLREKGQPDEAYALVNEMIALDRRLGVPDPIRTADLLTQRSTLLWSRSRYAEAIADLNGCIELYRGAGDILNAESRRCNLGLAHWLTGDLDPAEANLAAAMQLYQRIGLDQM